ncbi:hypothetical protein B0H10DRAFT_692409 [Mycena sp. CBHHK59/15]|nr:hypothetical protein B0H10DRAFT_692409 [Mycena sp. CBHHK59/15]
MLDSYLFLFSTGLLIFGVGLEITEAACSAGIYLCVAFYTSSKVLIYAFLTEKVYIVWGNGRRRLRTPVCIVCFATVALYVAVVIALFFGRISHFRPSDGACVIGLRPTATISLLTYDLYINVLLTTLFLWPLLRNHVSNAGLKHVTIRTLVASTAALVTSTTNVSLLTALKGRELGWLCLMTSGIDVIVNASALFWATGGGSGTLAFVPPTDHGHPFEGRDGHEHSATNAAAAHRRRMPHMPHMPRIPHFNMPHFANPSTTKPAAVIGPMPYNLAHFTRSAPMPRPPAVPLEVLRPVFLRASGKF